MSHKSKKILDESLAEIELWDQSFGEWDTDESLSVSGNKVEEVFEQLTQRLKCNFPFRHPAYAGQMLKPPHQVAWAAYTLAMSINPNNHALDGGPPSSEMEKEVVEKLATFLGYGEEYLGHLTSSGTIANLEALWVARESHPGKGIAFSENAHYTHGRMSSVLGVDSIEVPVDLKGSLMLDKLDAGEVGTLVITMGTTGLGEVEALHEILPWAREHGIRVHVDAAYGGFFATLKNSGLIDGSAWKVLGEADSIVIDPHKHGLQPYGCGCVLFKDPAVGKFYQHDSPYTYFTSEDLHLGEISLECSRAGAAAVALWTTLQLFPLEEEKGFGPILKKCRQAAMKMNELLAASEKLQVYKTPELDIITYYPATTSVESTSEISKVSEKVFRQGMKEQSFYLSLYKIPVESFSQHHPEYKADSESVTILRSVLMKPEHLDFVEELVHRVEQNL